jgi:hypothetical protein
MPDNKNPTGGTQQQSGPESVMDPETRSADNVQETNFGENASRAPYPGHRGHEDASETKAGEGSSRPEEARNIQPARPAGDGEDLVAREERDSDQPDPVNRAGVAHVKNNPAKQ